MSFTLALVTGKPAYAESSSEYAAMGRAAWSAFECSVLAENSKNQKEQERLFKFGYAQGLKFIAALQSGKVKREDLSKGTPLMMLLLLQGPTPDFMLGRVFEGSLDSALDDVYKTGEQWNEDDLAVLESIDRDWLDEPLGSEFMGDYQAAKCTEYGPGIEVYETIGFQEIDAIGLLLVQGDHPGSSFCGVRFDGNLEDLNSALSRAGLNMVVTRGA